MLLYRAPGRSPSPPVPQDFFSGTLGAVQRQAAEKPTPFSRHSSARVQPFAEGSMERRTEYGVRNTASHCTIPLYMASGVMDATQLKQCRVLPGSRRALSPRRHSTQHACHWRRPELPISAVHLTTTSPWPPWVPGATDISGSPPRRRNETGVINLRGLGAWERNKPCPVASHNTGRGFTHKR